MTTDGTGLWNRPARLRGSEAGFSLVELMVAMTVTLIVSAAIYGLLASGSNAFRREPEVADRQQNIRMAMDLIARDAFNAGTALPTFSQVFTRTDLGGGGCAGGLNGCGIAGTMGATAAAARGAGSDAEETDVLEIVSVDEQCPEQTVCSATPAAGAEGLFVTREGVPACMRLPGLALLADEKGFTIQPAAAASGGGTPCPTGGDALRNGNLQLDVSLGQWPAGTIASPFLYRARVVRYRIAPSGDPQDASPALWRSESGRYTAGGTVATEPGEGGFPGAGSPWELVARGIEDLQVEYAHADPVVWDNQPPVSTTDDWDSLVRQVRITLSARVTAVNLQGETQAAGGGPIALRGQLSTVVAPRAAFHELQMGSKIQ